MRRANGDPFEGGGAWSPLLPCEAGSLFCRAVLPHLAPDTRGLGEPVMDCCASSTDRLRFGECIVDAARKTGE
jgi:hypothetical protein